MMKWLGLISFIFPYILAAQSEASFRFYKAPDIAWAGLDMMALDSGKLLLMGSEYVFSPPYGSATPPIEGDPCLGNVFVLLDAAGEITDIRRLPNRVISGAANVPAFYMYAFNKSELVAPYYLRGFTDQIDRGLYFISVRGDKLEVSSITYQDDPEEYGYRPEMVGAAVLDDRILTVDLDASFTWSFPGPYILNWYDKNGVRLNTYEMEYQWLKLSPKLNTIAANNQSIVFFCNDQTNSAHSASFFETSMDGDSSKLKGTVGDLFFSKNILNNDNNFFVVDGADFENGKLIALFDHDYKEIWRKVVSEVSLSLANVEILNDGTFLLSHDFTSVSRFDKNGNMLATKSYGDRGIDRFREIVLLDDETFAILGDRDTGYLNSYPGHPFSYLFVIKDKVENLTAVGTDPEPAADKDEVRVFPNPAGDLIQLILPQHFKAASFQLFNIAGQEVFNLPDVRSYQQIGLSSFPPGLYFYVVSDKKEQHRFTGKISIVR